VDASSAAIASEGWRSALLRLCGRIVFLGGVPVVAYTIATLRPQPLEAVAYCLALVAGAAAGFLPRLDARRRGTVLVAGLLFLGAVSLHAVGPAPGGLLSLVSAPIIAGLVFGGRAGSLALAVGAGSLLVLGAAGRFESTPRFAETLLHFRNWPRMTAAYSVLTGLLVLLVSSAVRRAEEGLSEARAALARALGERRARTHAEDALRESEEVLRRSEAELLALFASMEDVILVLDSEGRYVRIAPTNPSLLYRPSAELLGRRLHDVFPREQADFFLGRIRECLETRRTVHFDYSLPIRGSVLWFAATVSPMLRDMVVWVARDVTESKHADERLREGEDRWRRISEATFEGVAFTENGVMIDVNEQLAQMLGYAPEELIGLPVEKCVAPRDRARVASSMRSRGSDAYEHRAMRKDGSTFPVEVRARALTLRGRAIRVTAVRDLSERTRLEAELRRRETLATMGSLVAGVAHEVRTPLFSLSATLDALEAGVGTPEEQGELRELLRAQLRRLSSLMQDLLDYGRPPRLKLALGGIREPLEHVVRNCQAQALHAGVRIEIRAPAGLPEARVDSGRLEQVFENLLVNALQHAPRGSTVTLSATQVAEPPGLVCAVEDEGPGLTAADMKHVFEPFFSRRRGGTGLGLAIAQRFVEAHGGSLTAVNRPGGGAAFTVTIPLDAERGESRA
jgi:PAS domain S-box-containing protein